MERNTINPLPMVPDSLSWFQGQPLPVAKAINLLDMGYAPNHTPNPSMSNMRQLAPQMTPQLMEHYSRAEQNSPLQMFANTQEGFR